LIRWEADFPRDFHRLLFGLDDPVAPGVRTCCFPAHGAPNLIAHGLHRATVGPMNLILQLRRPGEVGVLGEETVAGWIASTSPTSAALMMRSIFK
jgi:hypothetical protein